MITTFVTLVDVRANNKTNAKIITTLPDGAMNTKTIQDLGIIIGILGIILCVWLMYNERSKRERKRFERLKRDRQTTKKNTRSFTSPANEPHAPLLVKA